MKITRRKALVGLAGIVAAGIPVLSYLTAKPKSEQKWGFLKCGFKQEGLKTKSYNDLIQESVALDAERPIYRKSEELRIFREQAQPHIERAMRKQGMDLTANNQFEATIQHYGEPDTEERAGQMTDYCNMAVNYMNTRLSGLEKPPINWVILKHGNNHDKNFYSNGYAGQSINVIRKMCAKNSSTGKQALVVVCEKKEGGCMQFWADFDKAKLEWWYLFFSTGPSAIISAFSEPLALTTIKSTLKHVKELGLENAFFADETIHESLSHILALDAAKEFGIPGGAELVNLQIQTLPSNPFYSGMPKAITWARKNGMQNALDLYMESPKKYMDAIKSA